MQSDAPVLGRDPSEFLGEMGSPPPESFFAYFGLDGSAANAGASFEAYGGNDPLVINGDDLIAVTMISIPI